MELKKIAIIGAGWSGLQIAKVLQDCGYDIAIFEELADVGGTWSPQLSYYDLSVHTPIYICEFNDFQFPPTRNRDKKVYAEDIWEYCRNYAKVNNLSAKIRLNTEVVKLNYRTSSKKCIVTIQEQQNHTQDLEFDFVISTFFNYPRLPNFSGQNKFLGKIYHSNDIKEHVFDEICNSNAKVALLGGNKSATDIAVLFIKHNYNFNWIMREMYWFFSFDKLFWDVQKNKKASYINKAIYFTFRVISATFRKYDITHKIMMSMMFLLGFLKCPGKKHFNFKKFHIGWLDSIQYNLANSADNKTYAEIATMEEKSLQLTNGKVIDCDVLICATGCDTFSKKMSFCIDDQPLEPQQLDTVYRYSVIPSIPTCYFTGLSQVSPYGPMNGYNRSAAILKYMDTITDQGIPNFDKLAKTNPELFSSLNNNILFDSSKYIVAEYQERAECSMFGLLNNKDGIKTLFNAVFKSKSVPYSAADKYIKEKIAKT